MHTVSSFMNHEDFPLCLSVVKYFAYSLSVVERSKLVFVCTFTRVQKMESFPDDKVGKCFRNVLLVILHYRVTKFLKLLILFCSIVDVYWRFNYNRWYKSSFGKKTKTGNAGQGEPHFLYKAMKLIL